MSKAGRKKGALASAWYDQKKAKQFPVKVTLPDGTTQGGCHEMVFVGVNIKGQTVSIDKDSFDRAIRRHGDKAKSIILSE